MGFRQAYNSIGSNSPPLSEMAEAEAEVAVEEPRQEMIKLVTMEGHVFMVEKQAAMVSNTIKSMLTGPGESPSAERQATRRGAWAKFLTRLRTGMFTEQESDTVTFPEITKEVMEEVRLLASQRAHSFGCV